MNKDIANEVSLFEDLLSSRVEIAKQILGGNSKVSVLKVKNKFIIAKQYLGNVERKRNSLNREVSALEFLRKKNVSCVPKIIQVHEERHLAFLEYCPGESPVSDENTLLQMIVFVKLLKSIHSQDDSFPDAIGSVKLISDLVIQIENRLSSLKEFMPNSKLIQEAFETLSRLSVLNYAPDIQSYTYSVSDFGTHNMLCNNGSYKFIDLEFFGEDSPVKLISDFLLHPKNKFAKPLRYKFYKDVRSFFDLDNAVILEFLPLNALNWGLIVLRRLVVNTSLTNREVDAEIVHLAESYLRKAHSSGEQILAETLYLDS